MCKREGERNFFQVRKNNREAMARTDEVGSYTECANDWDEKHPLPKIIPEEPVFQVCLCHILDLTVQEVILVKFLREDGSRNPVRSITGAVDGGKHLHGTNVDFVAFGSRCGFLVFAGCWKGCETLSR